jgi:CubicO group peptidase (beta-lactamase class C family)
MLNKIVYFSLAIVLFWGMAPYAAPAPQPPVIAASLAGVIARYRQEIPQHMQEDNIPGLAIAIVDDQGILWEEGFGYTDWDSQIAVTPETLFSIQSMSKSFTATAAMFTAQAGLVDLDAPITTYLPDFHVNSIFEEHPEQKITLRMLLSHTAGFAHEAPYGSNYDHPAYSFEQHVASISDTWLKFPVGTRYSYSNLGIDLAGYILQVRSGMPFIQYVQEKVLDPLGMKDTTLDVNRVRATTTRAIGHTGGPLRPPVDFLLIPSGGVWTSAADMARYLQFHINKGGLDGTRLLNEDLAETMYTPPNPPAIDEGYALGITLSTRHGARHFQHGGGGFGFNDSMVWYPELKLGSVVLTNAQPQVSYAYNLSEEVLDSIINDNAGLYAERAANATHATPAYPPIKNEAILSDGGLKTLIESKALPEDAAALQHRSAYTGKYILPDFGFPSDTVDVSNQYGQLAYTYDGETMTLTEVKPGLFFSPYGDAFDFRGPAPLFTNIRMVKANTRLLPFQIAFYTLCGLVFLSALFFWPVRAVLRLLRRKRTHPGDSSSSPQRSRGLVGLSILAALTSFFSLFCLLLVALVPNLIYLPWPLPFMDLTWWQFALVGLPFINLVLAIGMALMAALTMRNYAWARAIHRYYLAVGLALLAFNLALIIL